MSNKNLRLQQRVVVISVNGDDGQFQTVTSILTNLGLTFYHFGRSVFLQAASATQLRAIGQALAATSVPYVLIYIANPVGGQVSAPNLPADHGAAIANFLLMSQV